MLRGQYRTDTQGVVRTYSVPVTEYRGESYWQGRYNPFTQPTLGTRMVPYTRWETHSDVVQVPVTRYETVPTTETVHVPVTTWHTVQDQVTQSRGGGSAGNRAYLGRRCQRARRVVRSVAWPASIRRRVGRFVVDNALPSSASSSTTAQPLAAEPAQ